MLVMEVKEKCKCGSENLNIEEKAKRTSGPKK
jgi:hypothetical protein